MENSNEGHVQALARDQVSCLIALWSLQKITQVGYLESCILLMTADLWYTFGFISTELRQ